METAFTGAARRELAFVVFLASAGLALVLLVAFAPWYGVVVNGTARPATVQPADVAPVKTVPLKKAVPAVPAEVGAALGR